MGQSHFKDLRVLLETLLITQRSDLNGLAIRKTPLAAECVVGVGHTRKQGFRWAYGVKHNV